MKVAILLTGALRTIRKTIKYFKMNLLLSPEYHVFACVQNDSDKDISDLTLWFKEQLGENLKYLEWFSLIDHNDWQSTRNKLISGLAIANNWKDYLRKSGSIIEYFQLQLAYFKMSAYEVEHGTYSYILRVRTDTIFAKPIDFHWLQLTDEQVQDRLNRVSNELLLSKIEKTPTNILRYFMTSIFSDDLIDNIQNIIAGYLPYKTDTIPTTASELNKYIKNGNYILTIRANNLYIVRRDVFYLIPALANIYGYIKSPYCDNYWFNAENQFQAACYHSGLTIFDYNTLYEDKSLYEYDEKRYFDLEFNVINPAMLYCLVRN